MDAHCSMCGAAAVRQSFFHHTFLKCPDCSVFILDDESLYEFVLTALDHPVQLEKLVSKLEEGGTGTPLKCVHCNGGLSCREVFIEHTELCLYECAQCRQTVMRPADLLLLLAGAENNKNSSFRRQLAGKAV